jgi:hypothetical protein
MQFAKRAVGLHLTDGLFSCHSHAIISSCAMPKHADELLGTVAVVVMTLAFLIASF